jgi:hypothetical protein
MGTRGDGERDRDEGWEEALAHGVATGKELGMGLQQVVRGPAGSTAASAPSVRWSWKRDF